MSAKAFFILSQGTATEVSSSLLVRYKLLPQQIGFCLEKARHIYLHRHWRKRDMISKLNFRISDQPCNCLVFRSVPSRKSMIDIANSALLKGHAQNMSIIFFIAKLLVSNVASKRFWTRWIFSVCGYWLKVPSCRPFDVEPRRMNIGLVAYYARSHVEWLFVRKRKRNAISHFREALHLSRIDLRAWSE